MMTLFLTKVVHYFIASDVESQTAELQPIAGGGGSRQGIGIEEISSGVGSIS